MNQIAVIPFEVKTAHPEQNFSWVSNPSVQKLLNTVVHILANEYVRAMKENPTLFKKIASPATFRLRPLGFGGHVGGEAHNDGCELL